MCNFSCYILATEQHIKNEEGILVLMSEIVERFTMVFNRKIPRLQIIQNVTNFTI